MGILLYLFEHFYEKHTSLSNRDFGSLTGQNLVAYSVPVSAPPTITHLLITEYLPFRC